MRDPETLPEDPEDWPRDPVRLLGVSRSADEQTIRRAYLKLIRRFKPDSFPAQFQLIREAYESLLQRIARPDPPPPSLTHSTPPSPELSTFSEQTDNTLQSEERDRLQLDPVQQIRKRIKAGEFDQVRQWAERSLRGGAADLGTLLVAYLLRQVPFEEVVSSETQLSDEALLGEILKRNSTIAISLLTERLRSNPAFARSELFHKWIQSVSDPRIKAELLQLRWGCLEIADWEMVVDDLESQRSWLLDYPEHWANLGCEVLKFACWNRDSERAQTFVTQFSQGLKSVAYDLQDRILLVLDQMDDVDDELQGRRELIRTFDWRLIPHSFLRHPWLLSRELQPLWELANKYPLGLIEALNNEAGIFPEAVAALRRLIRQAYYALVEYQQADPQSQTAAVRKFLSQQKKTTFLELRPVVLKFCADNGLDFYRFTQCADGADELQSKETSKQPSNEWNKLWRSDPGLDCVTMLLQLPLAQPKASTLESPQP